MKELGESAEMTEIALKPSCCNTRGLGNARSLTVKVYRSIHLLVLFKAMEASSPPSPIALACRDFTNMSGLFCILGTASSPYGHRCPKRHPGNLAMRTALCEAYRQPQNLAMRVES